MTWYLWILKYSPPQYAIDLLGKYLWRKKEREMQRQWGNAMMPFLKESKKERAMCIKCIRPQCNSRKVCAGWWGVLEPKYFIEKVLYLQVWVCIHKPLCKVTGLVQHLGSVAWTGLWWWIQKGRAQAISQWSCGAGELSKAFSRPPRPSMYLSFSSCCHQPSHFSRSLTS